jgi:hypothetical protein
MKRGRVILGIVIPFSGASPFVPALDALRRPGESLLPNLAAARSTALSGDESFLDLGRS